MGVILIEETIFHVQVAYREESGHGVAVMDSSLVDATKCARTLKRVHILEKKRWLLEEVDSKKPEGTVDGEPN